MRTLTALAVAATCLLAPTPAQAALPAAAPAASHAESHVVRLVTGDVVRVHGDDVQISPASRQGVAGRLEVQRAGGTIRVVPASARPYLGRFLDPALFDVTRPVAGDGRLPVRLRVAEGAAVPGVTLTSATTGYLTAASARAFGAALAQQWERDERAGFPERDELFPGVQQVQVAAPVEAPVAAAAGRLTLRLQALGADGDRVRHASVALMNVDDASRYTGFPEIVRGSAEVRVPAGHYSALGTVEDLDDATGTFRTRHVVVDDFHLTRDGQVLRFDARTATSRLAVATPRPATLMSRTASWSREDAAGNGALGSSYSDDGGEVFVNPTGPARRGLMHWSTTWSLDGKPGAGRPYTYDLGWGAHRVEADQSHRVREGDLATVRTTYYGARAALLSGRGPVFPGQWFSSMSFRPLETGPVRDEQVLADVDTKWRSAVVPDAERFDAVVEDGLRTYEGGDRTSTTWLRAAFTTGVPRLTESDLLQCRACRSGDVLSLLLATFRDAEPSHGGFLFDETRETSRLRLWRDGVQIADQAGTEAALEVAPGAATYRLLTQVDRRPSGARLATTLRTETTFRSGRGSGTRLSPRWGCLGAGDPCRALPLLQVRAPLPVALAGSLPTGTTTATVVAEHAPGSRAVPVTDLTVQTRTGNGTWVDATVTAQDGRRFSVVLRHSRSQAGQLVDLRISATDALGGTVSATTTDAYAVAG